jgi:hypothetical protein
VWWFGAALLGVNASSSGARADQFVVVDATYTATKDNTDDSHFRVDPEDGTPDNWRSPIDYASGDAYVRLEVIEKPSAVKTLYNICYEATPSYACMPYSPTYTAPGVYEFNYPFSAFYQYDQVDWSQGIKDIALILKDENQNKPQGDPDFYPTKIHVTITIVAPGSTYVPPSAAQDAGLGDASVAIDAGSSVADSGTPAMTPDAGHAADAGHAQATGSGGSASPPASMMPAPTMMPSGSGGQASPPAASAPSMAPVVAMPEQSSESQSSGSSGCSTAPPGFHAGLHWLLLAAALPIVRALLRRRPKSQGDVDG